jgi:hypothetical protein
VTGAVPEEASVSDFVAPVFTVTFPNASEPTLTVSSGVAGADPVPLNETLVEVLLDESVVMVIAPFTAPVTVGLKTTWSVMDWPACSDAGKDDPDTANPAPVRLTEFIVSASVPDAVKVSDLADFVFTGTAPKARVVPLTDNWAVPGVDRTTYPLQPEMPHTRQSITERNHIPCRPPGEPDDASQISRFSTETHARLMMAGRGTT